MKTIREIQCYIEKHIALLGFEPTCIGLKYNDRVAVLKEMGASDFAARCTNVTARIMGISIVEII